MPLVSVIIPSYNHAAYIRESVGSVLAQTLTDLELIVVDDGSQDQSVQILRSFSDVRMRVFVQENRGAHAAINRGLAESSGEYLAILNSDDVYLPNRLEILVSMMKSNPSIGLISSYLEVIDQSGKPLGVKKGYRTLEPWVLAHPERSFRASNDLRAALLTENYLATTSNYLFPRSIYERVGSFSPLRYAHDWDFALRVVQIADLAVVPEPLVRYRVHGANTISENRVDMVFEICWILAVHLPQQIADKEWFGALPLESRVDQLLHSIYTYGCDRVLVGLLLQKIYDDGELAMDLLNPRNAIRARYIDMLSECLADQSHKSQSLSGSIRSPRLYNKFIRKLRSIVRMSHG